MKEFQSRPVGKLSGGEYQKILLARAIAKEPELLLLDEPFSNMDFESRNTIQSNLAGLVHERRLTVLMVSHGLDTIPDACSRIVVMKDGKVVMDGKKSDVLDSDELPSFFMNGGSR
jgi:zinc/manganese transport system ATP-binding protein